MCFNIVIYNPYRKNLSKVFNVINKNTVWNSDGFSIWAPEIYLRTLNLKEFLEIQSKAEKSEIVHIHFRKASAGAINHDNVHMWKIGDYYVSHNGFVGKYSQYPNLYKYFHWYDNVFYVASESDTYQLVHEEMFKEFLEKKNWKELYSYLRVVEDFYGVMFLTNENEMIGIGMRKQIHVTYYKDILMFSNQSLPIKSIKKLGIRFKVHSTYEGIIKYDFEKSKFQIILMK